MAGSVVLTSVVLDVSLNSISPVANRGLPIIVGSGISKNPSICPAAVVISELPGAAVVNPSSAASLVNSLVIVTNSLTAVLSKKVYNLALGLKPSPTNLICVNLINGRTPFVTIRKPLPILSKFAIPRDDGDSPALLATDMERENAFAPPCASGTSLTSTTPAH